MSKPTLFALAANYPRLTSAQLQVQWMKDDPPFLIILIILIKVLEYTF